MLGHSMGGMTTAVIANRNPKRLRGLILADPIFLTPQRQREVHKSNVIGFKYGSFQPFQNLDIPLPPQWHPKRLH